MIAESRVMQPVKEQIRHLQKTGSTNVLIRGETGTGKELVARIIHQSSGRRDGPFVPVNCSTIPEQLAESSLFGHVRGAFTGATSNHKGYFELADRGSLFLDEIGDMPLAQQIKLLRVLEDNQFRPVGGDQERTADVRVIAATNAHLERKMSEGSFRRDLYYRLSTFIIFLPPLRERAEDIPLLAKYFVELLSEKSGLKWVAISPAAMADLRSRHLYGNIRELKNMIEHAMILCDGDEILPEHFPPAQEPIVQPLSGNLPCGSPEEHRCFGGDAPMFSYESLPLDQMEFLLVQGALAQAGNNINEAAGILNVSPLYIKATYQKIRAFHSSEPSDEAKIIQYTILNNSINNSECCALLKTNINRSSYLLKKLYKNGKLRREKGGRWTRYFLSDSIHE